MRKFRSLILAILMIYVLTGCGAGDILLGRDSSGGSSSVQLDDSGMEQQDEIEDENSLETKTLSETPKPDSEEVKSDVNKQPTSTPVTETRSQLETMAVDIVVSAYNEYVQAIEKAIREGREKLVIRVTSFDKNRYDDTPAKSGVYLNLRYSGYSMSTKYSGKLAVVNFEFSYSSNTGSAGFDLRPDANAIVVNNLNEFNSEIRKALKDFKTKITFKIPNYSTAYSLDLVTKHWQEDPLRYSSGIKVQGSVISDGGSGRTVVIGIRYTDKDGATLAPEQMLYWRDAAKRRAEAIVREVIKPGMTDLEKQKELHDYIVKTASYADRGMVSHTDYGVLIDREGVCESYAKAMYRLLELVGVPVKIITGHAGGEAHMWNLVQIDGVWYHLDATWNDPIGAKEGEVRYDFFNLTDDEMRKTHTW
jgi:hypothetical protein